MKLLYLHLPMWNLSTLPLGAAYLIALIKKFPQIELKFVDVNLLLSQRLQSRELFSSEAHGWWMNERLYQQRIKPLIDDAVTEMISQWQEFEPDLIALTVNSVFFALDLAAQLKQRQILSPIIAGGPICFSTYGKYRLLPTELIPYICRSEAEYGFADFLQRMLTGNDPGAAGGIEEYGRTPVEVKDEFVLDLATAPLPDYTCFNLQDYQAGGMYSQKIVLPLLLNRGCCCRCSFCMERKIWFNRVRSYPVKPLFEFMITTAAQLRPRYGPVEFYFNDLAFNTSPLKLGKLMELLLKHNDPELKFGGYYSLRQPPGYDELRKLVDSGCCYLNLGIESGSNKILKRMNKDFTRSEILKFFQLSRQFKINISASFIFGYPGESWLDYLATLTIIKTYCKIYRNFPAISELSLMPESDLFINAEDYQLRFRSDDVLNWKGPGWFDNRFSRQLKLKLANRLIRFWLKSAGQ